MRASRESVDRLYDMASEERDPVVEEFVHAHAVASIRRYVLFAIPALVVGAAVLLYGRHMHAKLVDADLQLTLPFKLMAFGAMLSGLGVLLVLAAIVKGLLVRRRRRRVGPPIPVARVRR